MSRFLELKSYNSESRSMFEILNEFDLSPREISIAHTLDVDNMRRQQIKKEIQLILNKNYEIESISLIGVTRFSISMIIKYGNLKDELNHIAHLNPRITLDSLKILELPATKENITRYSQQLKELLDWKG